jgi:hypothetical protein
MALKNDPVPQMVTDPDYKDGKPTKSQYPSPPAPPPSKRKPAPKKYANGGAVTRADGCITKGPTKGRMV